MKPKAFLNQLDDAAVVEAIRLAEDATSGEIRVFVSSCRLGSDHVADRALARFHKLGMARTRGRNGVLLYFAPLDQKFAVIGDERIHERCGETFWEEVAAGLEECFKDGRFTEGVVRAVRQAGTALARHFPRHSGNPDELPNSVERD